MPAEMEEMDYEEKMCREKLQKSAEFLCGIYSKPGIGRKVLTEAKRRDQVEKKTD